MPGETTISWCDYTWNILRGCTVVSPGCANCYAPEAAARFLIGHYPDGTPKPYEGLVRITKKGKAVWTGEVRFVEHLIDWPLRKRGPKGLGRSWRIFVNSMSDLFHESVSDEWLDRIFDVMEENPHGHTFQILTKRPERMRQYMKNRYELLSRGEGWHRDVYEPPKNCWLGVSVEDQRRATERIPVLLDTPAAVRFLSCEPLLGPLEFKPEWFYDPCPGGCGCILRDDADAHECGCDGGCCEQSWSDRTPKLHWIIDGGESGAEFRPDDVAWYRSIRDQCQAADVAYFHKQGAARHPGQLVELDGVVWHQFPGDNLGLPHADATLPIRTKEVHHGAAPWEADVPWTETKPPWKEQQVMKLVPGRTVDL